jgi:AraC-like DNA-binding protein
MAYGDDQPTGSSAPSGLSYSARWLSDATMLIAMALDIQVSMANADQLNPPGHATDRPNGFGEYLFVRFRTRMEVLTARGLENCEPGACLIYSPGHRQWYRGRDACFRDDWCHVQGKDVGHLLERAGLPRNTLFFPPSTGFYPLLIDEIRVEMQRQEPHWRELVAGLVARLILLLGRSLAREHAADSHQRQALRRVREQVHERLADPWTVRRMAALANLGESRFSVLYRQCFGLSPVEDLIRARLRHAQWLLTNRHTTVGEAAENSGFRNVPHFSRLFRRRVGQSPSQYRSPNR